MKIFGNMYDYYKYGKVVYESKKSGTVIRKKVNYPSIFSFDKSRIETVKTVLGPDRKVKTSIDRVAVKYDGKLSTSVKTTDYFYNTKTEIVVPSSRHKGYSINEDVKVLTNYSKPDYDYRMIRLPNGSIKYEIMYPERTIIKDGSVKTESTVSSYIKKK